MKTKVCPFRITPLSLFAALLLSLAAHAQVPTPTPAPLLPMPALTVPDGIGVSVHFTDPKPSEMQALSDAGFRWLRTDLTWNTTETIPGLYDFSHYDTFALAASQKGMKVVFILCYTNPLYNGGYSPSTPASRQAFANWALAAVARYQGRGYIWEVYNEPNVGTFWTASSTQTVAQKASDYAQLASVVGQKIKDNFPNERVVGPSVGYFDGWNANFPDTMNCLQICLQQNLCKFFDGITVHPYRTVQPEMAWNDYSALSSLITSSTYNTTGKNPPILSGEWGYASTWLSGNQALKAKYVSRSILHNYLAGVPLSIVYDWSNDGTNLNDPEQNFGLVNFYNHNVASPTITPLPAYDAVKTIYQKLGGYTFAGRVNVGGGDDFVLKFTKDGKARYVAWNMWGNATSVAIPCAAGVPVVVTSYDGTWSGTWNSGTSGGFYCGLTDGPQFIIANGQ